MARSSRRPPSSSPLGDQPWYVKTLVWVGAPTAGAAYLLYFVLHVLTAKLDTMTGALTQNQANTAALVTQLQGERDQAWATINTLSRICINTSRTDSDRIACATIQAAPK